MNSDSTPRSSDPTGKSGSESSLPAETGDADADVQQDQASDSPAAVSQVSVKNMMLRAGGRLLLDNANAEFEKGKITLIVGPSGVGKSLLLNILSGIQESSQTGVEFECDARIEGTRTRAGRSAIVFQTYALLDEFSPKSNVRFAASHRDRDSVSVPAAHELLRELNVPSNVPTSRLSGGQRQRLAIARALAYGKRTIFFDEPTAGLDIGTARKVAGLIQETTQKHGTTAIIVTHDYSALMPIAEEIYFLDPNTRKLERVPESQWSRLPERLDELSATSSSAEDEQAVRRKPWFRRLQTKAVQVSQSTTRCLEEVCFLPWRMLPMWRSPFWGTRFFLHYLNLITGVTAMAYLMVAGLILGFVTTYFTFEYLPFPQFSVPLIIEDILAAVGFGLFRIVIPVIGTVLIAARCGSAVTADIGSKEYGRQLDAMRSLNVSPERYLLTNILLSFLIGAPLLIFLSFQVARAISVIVFLSLYPNESADFWHQYFHRNLEVENAYFYMGTGWVLFKVILCGLGIGGIAYRIGVQPKLSSNDVSSAVTRTTLYSTIFVLTVHFVFAFYEFNRLQ